MSIIQLISRWPFMRIFQRQSYLGLAVARLFQSPETKANNAEFEIKLATNAATRTKPFDLAVFNELVSERICSQVFAMFTRTWPMWAASS